MRSLFVGLISGTSADGISAALVEFDDGRFAALRATHHHAYDPALRARLLTVGQEQTPLSLREFGALDGAVADAFAEAALALLRSAQIESSAITAIGSHGQTVFHDPAAAHPTTIQLGDPNRIAAITGIATVADFRRRDLALGGQGAPLVPAFHHALFARPNEIRCAANIGGIANITVMPGDDAARVLGFDTGPGNALMDEWIERHQGRTYDADGAWAASGRVDASLLQALLSDPYFALPPPKSTGRGHFRLGWASARFPALEKLAPADAQATFAELTARSLAEAIARYAAGTRRVLICGGGARNGFLLGRLRALLAPAAVEPSEAQGLDAEWVEAAAFAWLAMRTLAGLPGNLPSVTGAKKAAVLGGIYRA